MTENPINPAALYDYAASKNDMDSLRPEERTFLEACAWEWERLIDHGAEEWGKQFEALGIKPGVPQAPSAKPTPAAPEKPAPSSPAAERADEGLEEEAERLREAYTNDEGSWLEWPDCRQEPWLRVARAARALRRGGVTEDCVVVDREGYYALVKAQQERDSLAAKLAEAVREVNAVLDQLATARAEAERLRGERDSLCANDGDLFCKIMAEAGAALADAAIVGDGPFDGRHSLAMVERLAKEHKALRALGVREAEKNATPFVVDRESVAQAIDAAWVAQPFNTYHAADAAIAEIERQRAEHAAKGGAS